MYLSLRRVELWKRKNGKLSMNWVGFYSSDKLLLCNKYTCMYIRFLDDGMMRKLAGVENDNMKIT